MALHSLCARLERKLKLPRAALFAVLGRTIDDRGWTPPSAATAIVVPDDDALKSAIEVLRREAIDGELSARVERLAELVLLAIDPVALRGIVRHAVDTGSVSGRIERNVDDIAKRLERARLTLALNTRPGVSRSWPARVIQQDDPRQGWGAVLELVGVPSARLQDAGRLLLEHPAGPELTRALVALAPQDDRARVAEALNLAVLVDHDVESLGGFLAQDFGSARVLAGLPTAELEKVAAKAFAHHADVAARTAGLVDALDRAHPSASLLRYRGERLTAKTQDVLGRDQLLTINVERAYRDRQLEAGAQAARTRAELLSLQRVARLSGHARVADRLVEAGFDSAARIAFTPPDDFLNHLQGVADADELSRLHRRARSHYRATLSLFVRHNRQANGPVLRAMNVGTEMDHAAIVGAPSWEVLLGSADYCECEQCASVTSPAAYLVDLLLWLQRAPGPAPTPYSTLRARRPDLMKVLLSCDNTNTEVPYIDLVCELLEEEVLVRQHAVLGNGRMQVESSPGPWLLADGQDLQISIDGGVAQVVAFAAGDFADIATATPAEVIAVLNGALAGGRAVGVGAGFVIESAGAAPGSVEIGGGTAAPALGLPVGVSRGGALDARRRRRQTGLSAEEIRAYPEHLDPWVYTVLRGFTGQMVSPFELATAEMRAYLGLKQRPKLGLTRLELMALFSRGTRAERAAEHFQLALAEWNLIAAAAAAQPAQQAQWGFTNATVPLEQYLRRASSLRRGGGSFEYAELRALLDCDYPNPGGAVIERLEAPLTVDHCRASDRELAGFTLNIYDRQHRFLRLARRVSWTFAELDLLIRAGGGTLDADALVWLAELDRAGRRISLSAEELGSLFSDFSAADVGATIDGKANLYTRTFLVRADGSPPAFLRNPATTPTPLDAAAPVLQGALGLSADELNVVTHAAALAGNVTFATLSTLHRHTRLARAVGLEVEVFEVLRAAFVDPFADSEALLQFIDAADVVRGLTATDLRALTSAGAALVADVAPLTAAIDGLKQATGARLEADTGVVPAAAEIEQEIAIERSWVAIVCAWLGVDSRCHDIVAAADAGAVVAGLCANPPAAATLQALARVPPLLRALDVGVETASITAQLPGVAAVLRAPGFAALRQARWFQQAVMDSEAEPWTAFIGAAAVAPRAELASRLAVAVGTDAATVASFWDVTFGVGALDRAAILTPDHQARLARCLTVCASIGVGPELVESWAAPWPTAADAATLRNAIRSRLGTEAWLSTSTQVQDELRERRRDALVSWLLATAGPGQPTTTAELSGRFLIDLEMDDCMTTSRVVQANAAIQWFVQRCFSGQEAVSEASLDSDHWKQWDWRERYRLWEANRLVFLYPENFLNVARRSNASPLFKDFMKEVRQSERDDEAVRAALEVYLAGLDEIANLDHAAVATNLFEAGASKALHLVARTRTTPQRHYHRSLSGNVWTPWELLDVGTPGRHLALIHNANKTTLLWPTYADYPDPRQSVPGTPTVPAQDRPAVDAPPPRGVTYLGYGWVTKDRKKWSSVATSTRALLHQKRARTGFVTAPGPAIASSGTRIQVYAPMPPDNAAEQPGTVETPHLGWMDLQRDIVSIAVNSGRRALSDWLGGDHQPHIDTTATLAPIVCDFGPGCRCVFPIEWFVTPWAGLTFQDNRMVAQLTTRRLEVPLENSGGGRTNIPVLKGAYFSVAPNMYPVRSVTPSLLQGGFEDFTNLLALGSIYDFGADAFAVTDEKRSFLALSPRAAQQLAPQTAVPNGTRLLLVPAYHPFASELRDVVRSYDDGLDRVFTARTQEDPGSLGRAPLAFAATYGNHPSVSFTSANEGFEFAGSSLYAMYNWEIFFHAPLYVAEQLRGVRRFEEARRFYHFIFRPLSTEPVDPARPRARYWVTRPLREDQGVNADIRTILLQGAVTGVNPYADIENHPFDAQLVAQARPSAYQKHVVMRYLDNLIGWGDALFRSGEREQVMEAIQHYELARTILGPPPQRLQPLGRRTDLAFEDAAWGGGANALVDLENLIADAGEEPEELGAAPLVELPIVQGLYFCVPPNKALLRYWSEVERRLYNLRHCLSLDGAPVRYDLLAAPIDPQALVDAAAAGVSVADALAMAGAPLPPFRFRAMWGRAMDACNEVKALGNALQQALERRDAEALAAVRSTWEGKILERTGQTRQRQREQSQAEVDALAGSRSLIEGRVNYYTSREYMNDLEKAAVGLASSAAALDATGFVFDVLGGVLYLIPNIDLGISGFGGTPKAGAQLGGDNIGNSTTRTSQGLSRLAGILDRSGSMVGTQAGYQRRNEDWQHQASQARLELTQLDRQLAAARLRVAVSDAELAGHQTQRASWEETDAILREKFSNEERFGWMVEVLGELYREAFGQAVRLAKAARECLLYELPPRAAVNVNNVGDGLWQSLHHGLLAGERLSGQLRALDEVYATERPHHREVLQHVPLSHVDPRALVQLRRTGACQFRIPRWWWQRFDPTLSERRVKRVSVSVPSVTGPYTGLNATLRCAQATRVASSISTSRGINDFGVDVSVAAERYLPFEGTSLEQETTWTFSFPADPNLAGRVITDVDYGTITDLILHVEYVADEGGPPVLDAPPVLEAYIDLRAMDADAWVTLVMTPGHTCRVAVAKLVPRFLSGRPAVGVVASAALLDDGTDVAAELDFTLGAGADAGLLIIAPAAGAAFDWKRLNKVYVGLRM